MCGSALRNSVRHMLKFFVCDEALNQMCWAGTDEKTGFKTLFAITGCMKKAMMAMGHSIQDFDLMCKNWIRHSDSRTKTKLEANNIEKKTTQKKKLPHK